MLNSDVAVLTKLGSPRGTVPGVLRHRLAVAVCVCTFAVYSALGLIAHQALRTNAFDLSVFDYALWTTTVPSHALAYVPMFRYSLFAQHFMPTLLLLAPLSQLFDSPAYLVVLQTLFFAVAGFLLYLFADRHVSRPLAVAFLAAFLLSQRSHGAVTSYFYIESAEPMLIFGAVLAWTGERRLVYWILVALAMGCKEDVAIYFIVFGGMLAFTGVDRTTGMATLALASVWLAVSLFVAIPYWRHLYALGTFNLFLEGRYAFDAGGLAAALGRLFSLRSLGKLITITTPTVFLCFLSPSWLLVAAPGIATNLAALPDTGQAGLFGHYVWPILPWLFLAAVFGARRIPPPINRWLPIALAVMTLTHMPLARTIAGAPWKGLPQAETVRAQLRAVAPSGTVVAQPNLIPHLSRRLDVHGLGVYSAGQPSGDYVLLTTVGDLWPFDSSGVAREVSRLQADPTYELVTSGPLFAFRRR
jgi:uncharacterized membrane protein